MAVPGPSGLRSEDPDGEGVEAAKARGAIIRRINSNRRSVARYWAGSQLDVRRQVAMNGLCEEVEIHGVSLFERHHGQIR